MVGLELEQGSLIAGRYRLLDHLGEGGMGTVWSAMHIVTRRVVALKFLRADLQQRSDLRRRFLHEARAASALEHPNVIRVLDVFELEDHCPAMVMELLEGETLGQKLLRDECLSVEETAAIMVPVLSAVTCAHAAGVVHRDLKPENVYLARVDQGCVVKVLDFGIAKLSAEHYFDHGQSVAVTEAGCVLGTPRYMAPEQITNQAVDHRADIWSLGVMLYECLSGTRPVEGASKAEAVARLLGGAIVPLVQLAPHLPADLTVLVQDMLLRDPARRPQHLQEVSRVLSRFVKTLPCVSSAPELPPGIDAQSAVRAQPLARPSDTAARMTHVQRSLSLQTGRNQSTAPSAAASRGVEASITLRARRRERGAALILACVLLGVLVVGVMALQGREPTSPAGTASDQNGPSMMPLSTRANRATDALPGEHVAEGARIERSSNLTPQAEASPRAETEARSVQAAMPAGQRTLTVRRATSVARSRARLGEHAAERGAPESPVPSEEALFSGRK